MRTTITLDDDVTAMIHEIQEAEGKKFKEVIHELLRSGLVERNAETMDGKRYKTPLLTIGSLCYPSLDSIADVLEAAEGANYS